VAISQILIVPSSDPEAKLPFDKSVRQKTPFSCPLSVVNLDDSEFVVVKLLLN
jgi:hypothetical protein